MCSIKNTIFYKHKIHCLFLLLLYVETAKSSEKDGAKLEKTINEMKKDLTQEREKCKKLQDDLSAYTEKESKMTQSMSTVSKY